MLLGASVSLSFFLHEIRIVWGKKRATDNILTVLPFVWFLLPFIRDKCTDFCCGWRKMAVARYRKIRFELIISIVYLIVRFIYHSFGTGYVPHTQVITFTHNSLNSRKDVSFIVYCILSNWWYNILRKMNIIIFEVTWFF